MKELKKEWETLWGNKGYLRTWFLLLSLVLVMLKVVSLFLCYNENRVATIQLDDYVLNNLPASDVSTILFSITWICIFSCLPIALRTPQRSMVVFNSIIIIVVLRVICLYLFPLLPPVGIIPLRDPLLEGSFYADKILLKDLFFSGHTANLALLVFLVDLKPLKWILGVCTAIVAFLLLKQHVHYTVDVIFAPFFAYLSYKAGFYITKLILQRLEIQPAAIAHPKTVSVS